MRVSILIFSPLCQIYIFILLCLHSIIMENNLFIMAIKKEWNSTHRAVSKLVKIVMSLFFPVVILAYILAYLFGGKFLDAYEFNIFSNYISDLGSIKYTYVPLLFDLNAIITGLLCLLVFYHSNNIFHQI